MKYLLCILIINFVNVDCGLLNDALTPVTESVQNNALLDEHEHKDPKNKGLASNLVGTLDSAVDSLGNLLGQGASKDKADKKENKTEKGDATPKNDVKFDLGSLGALGDKNKTDEVTKEAETKKKEVESSTPSADVTTVTADAKKN